MASVTIRSDGEGYTGYPIDANLRVRVRNESRKVRSAQRTLRLLLSSLTRRRLFSTHFPFANTLRLGPRCFRATLELIGYQLRRLRAPAHISTSNNACGVEQHHLWSRVNAVTHPKPLTRG